MNPPAESAVLVIGIGNSLRGDDAVGRKVASRIRERNIPSVRVLEHDGEGASLMELWKGARTVILVDAVSSPAKPGTICRFDATHHPLPQRIFQNSTHAFGLNEAVELSRALNQIPPRLIIYGIEGKSFGIGGELSPEVEHAVPEVVDRIFAELRETYRQCKDEKLPPP